MNRIEISKDAVTSIWVRKGPKVWTQGVAVGAQLIWAAMRAKRGGMNILESGQDSKGRGDSGLYRLEGNKKEHRVLGEEEKAGGEFGFAHLGMEVFRSQHWPSGSQLLNSL